MLLLIGQRTLSSHLGVLMRHSRYQICIRVVLDRHARYAALVLLGSESLNIHTIKRLKHIGSFYINRESIVLIILEEFFLEGSSQILDTLVRYQGLWWLHLHQSTLRI